uniref:Deoxynucleoside kinase domain-containing protein n=1 Tax=viral metagenome TaxID=1070528 RepID=A0A6C0D940_9ZZZZ
MAQIISVDGNIGSGKSTFLKELKAEVAKQNIQNIIFIQEPVDQWSEIKFNNKTILEKFYEDPEKYAFPFQMMAYISRLALLRKAIKENPYSIIVSERSLFTDKYIFAKMLYDDKKIDPYSYQIYNMWFDEFIRDLPDHKYLYLESSPGVIKQRINKRNRQGENNIDINYLINCHEYHQEMFLNRKNLIARINMDRFDIGENNAKYKDLINNTIRIISNECAALENTSVYSKDIRIAYLAGIYSLLIVGLIFLIINYFIHG